MHEPSTRTKYTYDALGRLFTATTPEGGTTCFGTASGGSCTANTGYDNFNNLLYRTDARGVLTSYGYDDLNRIKSVSYTTTGTSAQATPSVSFTYGTNASQYNNGLLITMTDGVGSENYSYNGLEQLTQLQKNIGGTVYTTQYTYNFARELTQITYPSGRVVQQSVDSIGRLCEIAPSTTGCGTASSPYATGYVYNAATQMTGFKYGNGLYASLGFSPDRLQLTCLDYSTTNRSGSCTHDSTTKFGLGYSYPATPNNNGQISNITDSVDNGRSVAYTYDALYRLSTALTTGSVNYPQWGLSWGYDRYGNRLNQTLTAGSGYQGAVTVAAATNHITTSPYSYDASGSMTNDGMNTIVYDAENRAVSSSGTLGSGSYTYDGNGHRVQKVSGTTTTYVFSGSKVIAEYQSGSTVPSAEYIYSGSALLAAVKSSGSIAVPNGSFQIYNPLNLNVGCGPYNTSGVPDWTNTGTAGSGQPNSSCYNLPLPNGSTDAYSNTGTLSQTLGTTLQPNSTYTLSVYIGHGLDGHVANYSIALQAGSTTLATTSGSASTIPAGQFRQVTVSYSTGSTVPSGNIGILLTSGGDRIDYGGVQLTGPNLQYFHQDQLSNRLVTDYAGNTLEQMGHYPFGDPWYNATNDKWYFTSYERDSESGNDYAMARYFTYRAARFSSPDPLAGNLDDPQTLNRYAYVGSNPVGYADPTGMIRVPCQQNDFSCKAWGFDQFLFPYIFDEFSIIELAFQSDPDRGVFQPKIGLLGLLSVLSSDTYFVPPGGDGNCNFNVAINNEADLSQTGVTAIQKRISQIFGATPAEGGGTVGVNFNFTGKADATLNLTSGLVGALAGLAGVYGVNSQSLGINPTVFTNAVYSNFTASSGTIYRIDGTIAAHELVHRLGGIGDLPFDSSNPNLMSLDNNPAFTGLLHDPGLPQGLQLTPTQIKTLLDKCKTLHH